MPHHSPVPAHKLPAAVAVIAAVVMGAMLAGNSIGGSPMLDRREASGGAGPAIADYDAQAAMRRAETPPDQYAMITPEGRVEVAELSQRGLYSQRRFGGGAIFDDAAGWNEWEAQDAAIARQMAEWDRRDAGWDLQASAQDAAGVQVIRADRAASNDGAREEGPGVDTEPATVTPLPALALAN